jgi:hypothetical protein
MTSGEGGGVRGTGENGDINRWRLDIEKKGWLKRKKRIEKEEKKI